MAFRGNASFKTGAQLYDHWFEMSPSVRPACLLREVLAVSTLQSPSFSISARQLSFAEKKSAL